MKGSIYRGEEGVKEIRRDCKPLVASVSGLGGRLGPAIHRESTLEK